MENTHKHIQIYNAYKIYSTHAHTYACTQTAESTVGKRQEPSCSTKWKTRSSYLSNFLQGSSVEGHMCLREIQRDRERERATDRDGVGVLFIGILVDYMVLCTKQHCYS